MRAGTVAIGGSEGSLIRLIRRSQPSGGSAFGWEIQSTPEWVTMWSPSNCTTPTYRVGPDEITLLGVAETHSAELPPGPPYGESAKTGWAFHFVVHITDDARYQDAYPLDGNGRPSSQTARIAPLVPGGRPGPIYGDRLGSQGGIRGWTWGQSYPTIPYPESASVPMEFVGGAGGPRRFTVHLDEVMCGQDPLTGRYLPENASQDAERKD